MVRLSYKNAIVVEKHVHKKLKKTAIHQRGEWYTLDPETASWFVRATIEKLYIPCTPDIQFGNWDFASYGDGVRKSDLTTEVCVQ